MKITPLSTPRLHPVFAHRQTALPVMPQPTFGGDSGPKPKKVLSLKRAQLLVAPLGGFNGFELLQRAVTLSEKQGAKRFLEWHIDLKDICSKPPFKGRLEIVERRLQVFEKAGLVSLFWDPVDLSRLQSVKLTLLGAAIAQRYRINGFVLKPHYLNLKEEAQSFYQAREALDNRESVRTYWQQRAAQARSAARAWGPTPLQRPWAKPLSFMWEKVKALVVLQQQGQAKLCEKMATAVETNVKEDLRQKRFARKAYMAELEDCEQRAFEVLNQPPSSRAKRWLIKGVMLLSLYKPRSGNL